MWHILLIALLVIGFSLSMTAGVSANSGEPPQLVCREDLGYSLLESFSGEINAENPLLNKSYDLDSSKYVSPLWTRSYTEEPDEDLIFFSDGVEKSQSEDIDTVGWSEVQAYDLGLLSEGPHVVSFEYDGENDTAIIIHIAICVMSSEPTALVETEQPHQPRSNIFLPYASRD